VLPIALSPAQTARVTLKCLEQIQGLRNGSLATHSTRVGDMAATIALAMGMVTRDAIELGSIAAFHDVGKVIVPDAVLHKPGPLTAEEWGIMKQHPQVGYDILSAGGDPALDRAALISLHHHEAFNGSGYPHGASGNDIPLDARVVAVCDIYDALREDRPYRAGFSHGEAVHIICNGDGRTTPENFDPAVLQAFSKVHSSLDTIFALSMGSPSGAVPVPARSGAGRSFKEAA